MARYVLVVHSNPVDGREQEYNEWYDKRHLADLLALPGVIAARRYTLAQAQVTAAPQPYRYLALYEIETEDEQGWVRALHARAGTAQMPISEALSKTLSGVLWQAL